MEQSLNLNTDTPENLIFNPNPIGTPKRKLKKEKKKSQVEKRLENR
jgi:hypothetical protein